MDSGINIIRQELADDLRERSMVTEYRALWNRHGAIRFAEPTPMSLVTWLTSNQGQPEEKDAAVRVLVYEFQHNDACRELVNRVVILGLWPGLLNVATRLARKAKRPLRETLLHATSTLVLRIGLVRLDLASRVCATLLMNTEKEATKELRKVRMVEVSFDDDPCLAAAAISSGGEAEAEAIDHEMEDLIRLRMPSLEAELLLSRRLGGESLTEAASRLGVPYESAKKRHQRAVKRLPDEVKEWLVPEGPYAPHSLNGGD